MESIQSLIRPLCQTAEADGWSGSAPQSGSHTNRCGGSIGLAWMHGQLFFLGQCGPAFSVTPEIQISVSLINLANILLN
jgi:hypothetical protein